MAVSELIQKLVGRRKEREQHAKQTFDSVVAALADGETVDEHEVDAMLEACGKEPSELQLAVERLQQRREAVAKLAEVDSMRAEEREHTATAQRLAAERTAYLERIGPEIKRAAERASEAAGNANALESWAKRILESTAPASIAARIAELQELRKPLLKKRDALREKTRRSGGSPPTTADALFSEQQIVVRLESRGLSGTSDHAKHVEMVAHYEAKMQTLTAELADIESQLAGLDAEQAQAEAERYVA
ncbi:MAG: hypothetical protein DCC68_25285 [Planctomycetota bacterium]|nr:MAG: hypothetical protein DCC68_25285 [Planctomycetota bacterium]